MDPAGPARTKFQLALDSGAAALGRHDFAEARTAYGKARELEPLSSLPALAIANVCQAEGDLVEGRQWLKRSAILDPSLWQIWNSCGNLLSEAGLPAQAVAMLVRAFLLAPQDPRILSNLEMAWQYHPQSPRRALPPPPSRGPWLMPGCRESGDPIRVGFVSADLAAHPVGYFLLSFLSHLDLARIEAYAYSATFYRDTVSDEIARQLKWRDVATLDPTALRERIRADGIDVLFDLAGHTRGNRLPVFRLRAAPVQISWLGYTDTTRVPAMDYVLGDPSHIPAGEEGRFSERILRMPHSRFCYRPVPFAPEVADSPVHRTGTITFGSFNNLAKLHDGVLALWARVMKAVPGSRLILKWRSLGNPAFREMILARFAAHGVTPDRVSLRPASPHAEMLADYADIDIALDPFPFSGGFTSCEALWMGLPVVTLPGEAPASRQTLSFLAAIGNPELSEALVAKDEADYVRKAVALASDPTRLVQMRKTLREIMANSPLMNAALFAEGFTRIVEAADRAARDAPPPAVLHVGAGYRESGADLPVAFSGWKELRLDIDAETRPDVIGTMLDLSAIPHAGVDAIYSAHNIEHIYPHEVPLALAEFRRVLKPDGFLLVTCPDLQTVAERIVADGLMDTLYESEAGPVAPIDILYGFRPALIAGQIPMSHKGGFTRTSLMQVLREAGFRTVAVRRRVSHYDLWALATSTPMADADVRVLVDKFIPV